MVGKRVAAVAVVVVVAGLAGLISAAATLRRGIGDGGTLASVAPSDRLMEVRFAASVTPGLKWRFEPRQRVMRVHLGQQALALFTATSQSDRPTVARAAFTISPDTAGRYFGKIRCFCFGERRLLPGQSVDLPVVFFIDPAIARDPLTSRVGAVTLSYTLSRRPRPTPAATPNPQGPS